MRLHWSVHQGGYFIEGRLPDGQPMKTVMVEVGRFYQHAQLRTLNDVKTQMAWKAREAGGNAIIGFTYGQREVGSWRSLFHLDDVVWHGKGSVAVMSSSDLV